MDTKGFLFAVAVVGIFLVGAAALVGTALFVARRMMLDRLLKEWSNSREASSGRWSWLAAACAVLGLIAIGTALAAILGATEPSRMLNSSWSIFICVGLLGGFISLAVSSMPRRIDADTRSGDATVTPPATRQVSAPAPQQRRAA